MSLDFVQLIPTDGKVLVELLVLFNLRLAVDVLLHLLLVSLHDGLTTSEITTSCHCRTFGHSIGRNEVEISLLLKFSSVIAHFKLFGYDSETFRTIKSRVADLRLEG